MRMALRQEGVWIAAVSCASSSSNTLPTERAVFSFPDVDEPSKREADVHLGSLRQALPHVSVAGQDTSRRKE